MFAASTDAPSGFVGVLLLSAAIVIGESIGSYRITAKLGEGGMGAVYLGEHQFIARRAAIKVLLPELSANKDIVQRFFNEARATSVIHHPGIVEIVDCAVLPAGNAYIVMELLEHDAKKAVTLDKLGPDDIDDSDTCEKR
jgi:eukaryotic-like serine/threonine-protein kinase